MFTDELIKQAREILQKCRERKIMLATAESCTGGLISALLTEIAGSSDVIDRGFVTYSNDAKMQMLDVREDILKTHGAVSPETVRAMVEGALKNSKADIAVSITGIAGPGGGSETKSVGLVYIATSMKGGPVHAHKFLFGDIGRGPVRIATVRAALELIGKELIIEVNTKLH